MRETALVPKANQSMTMKFPLIKRFVLVGATKSGKPQLASRVIGQEFPTGLYQEVLG
jgi:hypothetical protein